MKDGRAVLEATGTEDALLGGLCDGGGYALMLAATDPAVALGVAAISPSVPRLTAGHPNYRRYPSTEPLDTDEGWAKWNVHYWQRDFRGFLEFFFSQQLPEPHSTKQVEDCVRWGLDGGVESLVLADEEAPPPFATAEEARDLVGRVRCPVLVVHGELDNCQTRERALAVAELTGGTFVGLEGAGHMPTARHPVKVNGLLKDFADQVVPPAPQVKTWTRALSRRRRALYVSSPIGLGHARRDVAIAQELRKLHPDLEIDWLAQHPVTAVLEAEGERIHPASALLANESAHIESESAEHDLHAFQAIRRMDEILVANFMLFLDVVREENYDLWIGDEAWEVDYFLHENPELKSSAYVWLTDFVGWLPFEDGGEHEAFLTTDYNAEMIEHIARFPRIRDRAVFVGNPDDVVPELVRKRPPGDPRLDGAALRLLRLRDRVRARRRPGEAARRARLPAGRAGLHRHRRRVGRRRPPAAPRDRGVPAGEGERARAADGRRRWAANRPGEPAAARRPRDPRRTCTSSTATSRPATSPSSRAA